MCLRLHDCSRADAFVPQRLEASLEQRSWPQRESIAGIREVAGLSVSERGLSSRGRRKAPPALTGPALRVPSASEREIEGAYQPETDAPSGPIARTTQATGRGANVRDIEHGHGADRIDVHFLDEGLQSPVHKGHLVGGFGICQPLINSLETRLHELKFGMQSRKRSRDLRAPKLAIETVAARTQDALQSILILLNREKRPYLAIFGYHPLRPRPTGLENLRYRSSRRRP